MDGLASGIAIIAAGFLALSFINTGQLVEALMLIAFGGALLGFLVYNSNPASIFMGDCGSMFVGFFLASSALVNVTGGRSRSFLPVLAVPILVLFIPIFDTTFVTVLRKFSGRAASQGGRDHTSHRLVALGMSERHAVLMLYGFAALSGFWPCSYSGRVGCQSGCNRRLHDRAHANRRLSRRSEGLRQNGRGAGAKGQASLRISRRPLLQTTHLRSPSRCRARHPVVLVCVRDKVWPFLE